MSGALRKANQTDLPWVIDTYRRNCDWAALQDPNPVGWTIDRYPTPQVAEDALEQGTLYVYEQDGNPAATLILNHDQPEEYNEVAWNLEAPEDRIWVVHTFMVRPGAKGGGLGRKTLEAAHTLARRSGLRALRLDTSEVNLRAQRLYQSLGYALCGMVDLHLNVPGFRWFHCYEIRLD